ncbi:hypothetical protein JTE90_027535 [Oedothorax gibbosus]|uniref:Agouti domain-containing protein n=1 Tax=Oedothorax gibbosus TaxID=931172 RepID=A0AAV6VKY0_9ARAC|nr:hypothetical protein JTE90_027535 [Oedothorax gibbosus]
MQTELLKIGNMKTLLLVGVMVTFGFCCVMAHEASRLGPEERRTLLDEDDDDMFPSSPNQGNFHQNSRQNDCARDFEDCSTKSCCNQCTMCSCNRNRKHCRCQGRSELALFLGLCNG